jgi:NADH-quinone oxidoreductase subunit M
MEHSSNHLLSVILFTPLLGALLLLFIPRDLQLLHRLVGNLFGVLGFLVSLPLMLHFPAGSGDYAFRESADWIPSIGAK